MENNLENYVFTHMSCRNIARAAAYTLAFAAVGFLFAIETMKWDVIECTDVPSNNLETIEEKESN